ncbi:MAG: endopeptidase La, partial [Bacteroidota bacterium]
MNDEKDKTEEIPNEEQDVNQQAPASDLVVLSDVLPDNLTIIPVMNRPIFPGVMTPMNFGGQKIISSLKHAYNNENGYVGIVLVKEQDEHDFERSELYSFGTIAKIYRMQTGNENQAQVILQGLHRFEYVKTRQTKNILKWDVKYYKDPEEKPDEVLKAYANSIIGSVKELINKNALMQEQLRMILSNIPNDKPGLLMDLISSILSADSEKLQELLESINLTDRGEKLLVLLREEIELSEIQGKIQKQIDEKVNKQQKEFFLREQLKAIKQELGIEKDDKSQEIEKLKDRIKDLKLTDEVKQVIDEEMEKMQVLEPSSSEYQVTRGYLSTLTELPWGIFSEDNTDIKRARNILDRDHYGLQDVKDAILQYISTIIKRGTISGSIICLVGPPGVGKTSVGRSIAHALDREFFRFSVGGMRDEAEIKGHRRTYIGAMPGKIIQSLKRTGTSNPVIMLDEIDKLGISFQGDPASALLEVLDPEQNKDFLDHYLDVRYDLSNILFITTANQMDTIPRPLLDRMEIIQLPGYIMQEKIEIAKRYLIPRQARRHGLKMKEINITDKALEILIDSYAREAGVRNLEKRLQKIMRKTTLKQAEEGIEKVNISRKNVEEFAGKPVFNTEKLYNKKIPGVALGLAWTSMGGATLYIEANSIRSKSGRYKQTGQLGNVMKESTQIAYSYVRSILCKENKYCKYFDEHEVHLHVPAGATPKDGPSAGITMALALYSLAVNKAVEKDLAMTGELTLTGKVLPIGGVREKTIAARRVGVHNLIFPKENKSDFEALPDHLKEGITP